ncbi:MAG: hypothetical protein RLZZ300_2736, partial [Pseudomonadota bacterium]
VWEHMDSFDAKQNRLAIEHEQHKDELPEGEYGVVSENGK